MKIFKKILIVTILILGFLVLGFLDHADRSIIYSKYVPEEGLKEFTLYKTIEEVKQAYERHFNDTIYRFPRCEVKKVLIYKNIPVISRLTKREVDKNKIVDFVNNPDNFDWGETTWTINESEYILRFYDYKNKEIGKIWLCMTDCGMTESIPFSPNMKFGGLSFIGRDRLTKMINEIYKTD
jgi:hypothetical protein